MPIDFKDPTYLKNGNTRQKLAYNTLSHLGVFEKLAIYNPVLTGTIPLEIDIPESDLDISCYCKNHEQFAKTLHYHFGNMPGFHLKEIYVNNIQATLAEFTTEHFTIELFGQTIPTEQQYAYRHLLIEDKLLRQNGPHFMQAIKTLKLKGIKTEPAFAKLLNLDGNPYEALLNLEENNPTNQSN